MRLRDRGRSLRATARYLAAPLHCLRLPVRRITGHPVPVVVGARRAGDPPRLVADAALAREQLDWQPRYPDLDTIVAHAWAWERRHAAWRGQERP